MKMLCVYIFAVRCSACTAWCWWGLQMWRMERRQVKSFEGAAQCLQALDLDPLEDVLSPKQERKRIKICWRDTITNRRVLLHRLISHRPRETSCWSTVCHKVSPVNFIRVKCSMTWREESGAWQRLFYYASALGLKWRHCSTFINTALSATDLEWEGCWVVSQLFLYGICSGSSGFQKQPIKKHVLRSNCLIAFSTTSPP